MLLSDVPSHKKMTGLLEDNYSVREWDFKTLPGRARERIAKFARSQGVAGMHASPQLLDSICRGFRHKGYWLECVEGDEIVGVLPLVFMKTMLFGRFLVSLPYLNWGGVVAKNYFAATRLVDRAVELSDELDVRFLELRHESVLSHPKLTEVRSDKCQMRMALTGSEDDAWKQCRSTVRTQVRKGDRHEFEISFGGRDQLDPFYYVFARNMRDLGTPVYSQTLFGEFIQHLADVTELCVVRKECEPIACALVFHHASGLSEVPSASALREHRSTAVNTWMYWQLIRRAVERGANTFDFGRSTPDGPTFDFKRKWGARPSPSAWQYYARHGEVTQVRPENEKYDRAIETWKRLPLWLSRLMGPTIVRGIP